MVLDESISGVENAALAFVPEEYLSPLPRGASIAMIRTMGPTAGLIFNEGSADYVAKSCSDVPFWIRRACSAMHKKLDAAKRPISLKVTQTKGLIDEYVKDEGAAICMVALQHLFRVYPEIKSAAFRASVGDTTGIDERLLRVLTKYGILNAKNRISGRMVDAGLHLLQAQKQFSDLSQLKTMKLYHDVWN